MNNQNYNEDINKNNAQVSNNSPSYEPPRVNPAFDAPSEQPASAPQSEPTPPEATAVPMDSAEVAAEQVSGREPILEHSPGVASSKNTYTPPVSSEGRVHTNSTLQEPPIYTPPEPPRHTPPEPPRYTPPEPPRYTPPEPPRYTPPERVYIGVPDKKPKPEKKPKAKLSFGAAALLILLCVALSGGAAFGGTLLADRYLSNKADSDLAYKPSSAKPSVIFQSLEERNEERGTYAQVAEAVSPTVVEIVTEYLVADSYLWGSYVTGGAGSGVIISADGMIITNNHVVSDARNVLVRLSDGTEYTAEVIGTDADTDIAVIKIDGEDLPFAVLGNSDELHVGEEIVAVGNPLGELGGTVTSGIVSALSRDVTIDSAKMTLIQMDAAVNPGNSGGGLFNLYGELIGIVNAKTTSSSSGVSVEGIGFAIPVNTVSKVAEELINYGYVRGKVMLGIKCIDIASEYDAFMSGNRYRTYGAYVSESSQPNLKVWDRIIAIDGEEVMYSADIKAIIAEKSVGDTVKITVFRNGKQVTVDVTLLEYKPEGVDDYDDRYDYDDDDYDDRYDDDDDYDDRYDDDDDDDDRYDDDDNDDGDRRRLW